jgi:hypothetical protein
MPAKDVKAYVKRNKNRVLAPRLMSSATSACCDVVHGTRKAGALEEAHGARSCRWNAIENRAAGGVSTDGSQN